MSKLNSAGLDIIIGPMFSNKTTELLKRLFTAAEVGLNTLYINHSLDKRNQYDVFSTHNPQLKEKLSSQKVAMISIADLKEVDRELIKSIDMIGVDEAHFFLSLDLVLNWVNVLNKRVIVAGLDGDYKQEKFGHIMDLVLHCDTITKQHAYCVQCAKNKVLRPAIYTIKLTKNEHVSKLIQSNLTNQSNSSSVIDVGAHDKYESVCREHHSG